MPNKSQLITARTLS